MARVLVSGASGPIGKALLPTLRANGAHITRLVRNNAPPSYSDEQTVPWHPEQPLSADVLSGFDAVIHLAGETIVGRWSDAKKTKIRDSRVIGTRNIAQALAQAKDKPQIFLSSSAIGYYGDRGDDPLGQMSQVLDEAGYTSVVATNCDQAYHRYLKTGEQLSVRARLLDVIGPKRTALGEGWFVTTRSTWFSADEPVATMDFRILKFRPSQEPPSQERPTHADPTSTTSPAPPTARLPR